MAKDIAVKPVDIKTIVENGELSERARARATAEALIAQADEAPRVGRFVNALGLFGIDEADARGAVRDLVGDGRVTVVGGLVQAS